jgi:hypothetical protein
LRDHPSQDIFCLAAQGFDIVSRKFGGYVSEEI